jgi:hypothetical protein
MLEKPLGTIWFPSSDQIDWREIPISRCVILCPKADVGFASLLWQEKETGKDLRSFPV